MQGVAFTKELLDSNIRRTNSCWIWTGRLDKDGYGRTWYRGHGNRLVHRLMYELYVGRIGTHMLILHNIDCVSRACCNPEHLRQGTHAENMKDVAIAGTKKGSRNPRAKLTEYQVEKIHKMHASGVSVNELSQTFNISRRAIHNIVYGISWEESRRDATILAPAIEGVAEFGDTDLQISTD